jgi:hypothetical protein
MASGSATRIYHSTLAAAVADTVTLAGNYRSVIVYNRGATDLFVTVGATAVVAPPTVAGAEDWVVPANQVFTIPNTAQQPDETEPQLTTTVVKLISSGTPAYSVEGD